MGTVRRDLHPEPECHYGYSARQLLEALGEDRMAQLERSMELKAHPTCSGREPCIEAHGRVYYVHDVERLVERRG